MTVSLSWCVAVDLTPASARPYVGSSGTNSEINLAFGYNGLERLTGRLFGAFGGRGGPSPRATSLSPSASNGNPAQGGRGAGAGGGNDAQQANAGGFTRAESGAPSPLRLFNSALGGHSWLLPLAMLGLLAAAWRTRLRLRLRPRFVLDRRQQSLVLWGAWLLTTAAFFSMAGFFHSYYMVTMAPSIAALAGIGAVSLWSDYRNAGWRAWALPVALLITAGVQAYLLATYPGWSAWLTPLVLGLAVVAALALLLARLSVRLGAPVGLAAAGLGIVALIAAPTVWAADTVANGNSGGTPTAGPRPQGGGFPVVGGQGAGGQANGAVTRAFGGGFGHRAGFGGFGGRDDATANSTLVRYLEANQGHTTYLVATLNSMTAAPLIIQTGKPVMALGGFSGADRIVTPAQLSHLVTAGTVRYFLLNGGFGGFGGFAGISGVPGRDELSPRLRTFIDRQGGPRRAGFGGFAGGGNADLTQWVTQHCAAISPSQSQMPRFT